MRLVLIVICMFSSLAMAKSIPNNTSVNNAPEMILVGPFGECASVQGQSSINDLLAQDWVIDEMNICGGSILESAEGDCVETASSTETNLLIKNGYTLLDINSCN